MREDATCIRRDVASVDPLQLRIDDDLGEMGVLIYVRPLYQ
jgi:hypothetical protein